MKIKNKIFIIIIIFALIGLVLIVFLIYPVLRDIKNISDDISSRKKEVALVSAEYRELYDFKKKYDEYKDDLNKIDQLFVNSQDPVDFIKFLETTSSNSGINIETSLTSLVKNKATDKIPVISFQIHAKGDFANILRFSERLETDQYLIKMKNFTVKKSEQHIGDEKEPSIISEAIFLMDAVAN